MFNMDHKKVKMLLKAIAMSAAYILRLKGIITIPILKDFIPQYRYINHGVIFKTSADFEFNLLGPFMMGCYP